MKSSRKKRLRSVSAKKATELREYSVRRRRFLRLHRLCAAWPHCQERRLKLSRRALSQEEDLAAEIHHTRGRAGRLLLDERHWRPVCHSGHELIHQQPAIARVLGLLCEPGQWGKQPDPPDMERKPEAFMQAARMYLRNRNAPDAVEPKGSDYGLGDWEAGKLRSYVETEFKRQQAAAPPTPKPITLDEMLVCARRELGKRKHFYPRWIEAGRMKPEVAAREIACMEAIHRTLTKLSMQP